MAYMAFGGWVAHIFIIHDITDKIKSLTIQQSLNQAEIKELKEHQDILAKMVQQEQYQLDVITEYIKGNKWKNFF